MSNLNDKNIKIGGKYNWQNQSERLVYIGKKRCGQSLWHQFAKIECPEIVWCEVSTGDLIMLEETN